MPRPLRTFLRRQRGTSYTLPFVMVVPFYLAFVLAVFEAGFLVLARVGTQYAAHAAARSAVVWQSAGDAAAADRAAHRSAWMAIAPFILGRSAGDPGPVPPDADAAAPTYGAAMIRFAGSDSDLYEKKFRNAAPRTTVTVENRSPGDPHGLLRVTVTFRAPLYVPVVSRFLAPDGNRLEFPLTATVTLPNEAPESASGTLGIDYRPRSDQP
jgi:Flp pilus assembly protein TadG